jgi:hypothetical protein
VSTAAHSKAYRKRKVTESDVTFSVTLMEIIQELRAENSSLRVTLASRDVTVIQLNQRIDALLKKEERKGSDSSGLSSESPTESAPNGASGNFTEVLWHIAISYLTQHGQSEARARPIIGKWRKDLADDGKLLALILETQKQNIVEPVGWISKAIKTAVKPKRTFGRPGLF